MPVRVDVAPELLRWAVERAGWDAATTERRAPQLRHWLAGTRTPTLKQLEGFAASTHTPFGLLFLDRPPVEDVPIPDLRTMGNKAVLRPSADLLDAIYLCQERQDWYRAYAQDNGIVPPDFIGSATISTPSRIAAEQISERLDFGLAERKRRGREHTLRLLVDRIEAIGVLVMISGIVGGSTHRRLNPEEFRGFALCDPYASLIFVNGADTKAAQIFTLIHELAHIWLGDSALSDAALAAKDGEAAELWCNEVAAEVLVPLATLRGDCPGTQPMRLSGEFARAVIADTLAGSTSYREAYRLLGTTKHSTFEKLAKKLKVP